jgi:hypothetical protein
MLEAGIQQAVFTDDGSNAYLAGFWGYLGIEFGRPTSEKRETAPFCNRG